MNLFSQQPETHTRICDTLRHETARRIRRIRAGIIQKDLIITPKTCTADRMRILVIQELENESNN